MQNIMTAVMRSLAKDMQNIEPLANLKMSQTLQTCFGKSGNNGDRFADCVINANKKINDVVQPFQFKLLFVSKTAQKCLKQNKTEQTCIQETTKVGKNIIQNMLKTLEKI